MSLKYHINPETGNPNQCRAKSGNCPFGTDADHYPDKDTARAAYEAQVEAGDTTVLPSVRAKVIKQIEQEHARAQNAVRGNEQSVKLLDQDIARNRANLPTDEWNQKKFEEEYGYATRDSLFARNDEFYNRIQEDKERYDLGDRVMAKAIRWLDFTMLGSATGAAAGAGIFASQGRPGLAAILGTVTALMSAPQWWPAVKAKVETWRARRELADREPAIKREIEHLSNVRSARVASLLESQKQAALVQARMTKVMKQA